MWIERTIGKQIEFLSNNFKVVLLTGPRQVGKTSLLRHLQPNRETISLDDLDTRLAAQQDPVGFLARLKLPVLIDEIQYAPSLLPAIKQLIDQHDDRGLFWLTGSQAFEMIQGVSESLAGRVGVLDLMGISQAEEQGQPDLPPFLPTPEVLEERRDRTQPLDEPTLFHRIWRGSKPQVVTGTDALWESYYRSYLTTYIERDVRNLAGVNQLATFRLFMQLIAARTGQSLNLQALAQATGISQSTAKQWLHTLEASGIVYLLEPYFNNFNKRITKKPKLYMLDTGLCCYLTRWTSGEVLSHGAMAGPLLETYALAEIIKSYRHHGMRPPIYYYADKDKREIDILIEHNGKLHPIEIKKTHSVGRQHGQHLLWIQKQLPIGPGCVLCFHAHWLPWQSGIDIVPFYFL